MPLENLTAKVVVGVGLGDSAVAAAGAFIASWEAAGAGASGVAPSVSDATNACVVVGAPKIGAFGPEGGAGVFLPETDPGVFPPRRLVAEVRVPVPEAKPGAATAVPRGAAAITGVDAREGKLGVIVPVGV